MKEVCIIVAMGLDRSIGKNGGMPWGRQSADMKRFAQITKGTGFNTVIMGRKTFESLPKGALPGRENIVITRDPSKVFSGALTATSLEEAIGFATGDEIFIVGGGEIYRQAMTLPDLQKLYVTKIEASFPDADTFFPELDSAVWRKQFQEWGRADEKNTFSYAFYTYTRKE